MSTLTTVSQGWVSASLSSIGATARQGPHQGAQKSTSTMPLASIAARQAAASAATRLLGPRIAWPAYSAATFGASSG